MANLFKYAIYAAALVGILMISINGYIYYQTGEWGGVTFLDVLSYITGREVTVPDADQETLRKWVDR